LLVSSGMSTAPNIKFVTGSKTSIFFYFDIEFDPQQFLGISSYEVLFLDIDRGEIRPYWAAMRSTIAYFGPDGRHFTAHI
jgi:hypothetical protein